MCCKWQFSQQDMLFSFTIWILPVHLGFHWAILVRLMLSTVPQMYEDTSLLFAGGWFLQKNHFVWWFYWHLQWTSIDQERYLARHATSVGYFKNTKYVRYTCLVPLYFQLIHASRHINAFWNHQWTNPVSLYSCLYTFILHVKDLLTIYT